MLFQIVVRHMLQYVWLLKSHTTLLPTYTMASRPTGLDGSVGHTDGYVALYMIKKN